MMMSEDEAVDEKPRLIHFVEWSGVNYTELHSHINSGQSGVSVVHSVHSHTKNGLEWT